MYGPPDAFVQKVLTNSTVAGYGLSDEFDQLQSVLVAWGEYLVANGSSFSRDDLIGAKDIFRRYQQHRQLLEFRPSNPTLFGSQAAPPCGAAFFMNICWYHGSFVL